MDSYVGEDNIMMTESELKRLCERVKAASRALALIDTKAKNGALVSMADSLVKNIPYILKENGKDISWAKKKRLSDALIDRLTLTSSRIESMADSLKTISKLKDPVGETLESVRRPNGLLIKKIRVPIGVIFIIYESRPNVTSDCMGLCLKSGNACILRGASDAVNSNRAIFNVLTKGALKFKLPKDAFRIILDKDRRIVESLLKKTGLIDLVMPRGGESLINSVTKESRIPVIKHYKGVCHTYVDKHADLLMAQDICFNAKVQRPGVCNAMETMLVHKSIAKEFLPPMIRRFRDAGVEIRGCAGTRRIVKDSKPAKEIDWYTEYLDLILSVKVVDGVDDAISHIMKYGSSHSDSIVTQDKKNAAKILKETDSPRVYLNASTRFTDGGEFGKGAEIGISTDKIHARGPMGMEELTSYKYVIYGNGQIRQ